MLRFVPFIILVREEESRRRFLEKFIRLALPSRRHRYRQNVNCNKNGS